MNRTDRSASSCTVAAPSTAPSSCPAAVPVRARQTPGGKPQSLPATLHLCNQRFNSAAVPHMASPFLIHAGLQISTAALAALGLIQSAVGCHLISASDVLQNMPPLLTTGGGGNSDNPAYSGGSESVSTLNEVPSECQTQKRYTLSQPLTFCLRLDSPALGDGHINSTSDFFLTPLSCQEPQVLVAANTSSRDGDVTSRQHCRRSDWRGWPVTLGEETARA
jgi:hypothetical protein